MRLVLPVEIFTVTLKTCRGQSYQTHLPRRPFGVIKNLPNRTSQNRGLSKKILFGWVVENRNTAAHSKRVVMVSLAKNRSDSPGSGIENEVDFGVSRSRHSQNVRIAFSILG